MYHAKCKKYTCNTTKYSLSTCHANMLLNFDQFMTKLRFHYQLEFISQQCLTITKQIDHNPKNKCKPSASTFFK